VVNHLVFTIMAPLGAWGSPGGTAANAAVKTTDLSPTRSAIVGLLAACLGAGRAAQARLAERVMVAVRTDVTPVRDPLLDYHTITRGKAPDHGGSWTRFEEVREAARSSAHKGAILSRRESFSGGLWTVAVAINPASGGDDADDIGSVTLAALAAAMKVPVYMPYIGRRCYPLGLPFDPDVLDADGPVQAMTAYGLPWTRGSAGMEFAKRWLKPILDAWGRAEGRHQLAWDAGYPGAPAVAVRTVERRDDPAHVLQPNGLLVRTFNVRNEHQAMVVWQRETPCSAVA
jgi:CRISPR system Cascade subunit CasD